MGAIVVVCVETREPAAKEDWVGAEAITGCLEKLWYQDKLRKQMQKCSFSLFLIILVTEEVLDTHTHTHTHIYYVMLLTAGGVTE
jgi:hypothetical protein